MVGLGVDKCVGGGLFCTRFHTARENRDNFYHDLNNDSKKTNIFIIRMMIIIAVLRRPPNHDALWPLYQLYQHGFQTCWISAATVKSVEKGSAMQACNSPQQQQQQLLHMLAALFIRARRACLLSKIRMLAHFFVPFGKALPLATAVSKSATVRETIPVIVIFIILIRPFCLKLQRVALTFLPSWLSRAKKKATRHDEVVWLTTQVDATTTRMNGGRF